MVIGVFLFIVLKYLAPVFGILAGKKRQLYDDKNPDINKRMRTLMIANAKRQKPPHFMEVILQGDSKKLDLRVGKVNGLCEDRRVMNISYKPSFISRSRLFLVPNELIKTSSLNKKLTVRANGIKTVSMGLIDVPVITEDDADKQEKIRTIINDYWQYLLEEEKSYMLPERTMHNVMTAPGSTKLDKSLLLQAEREYETEEDI